MSNTRLLFLRTQLDYFIFFLWYALFSYHLLITQFGLILSYQFTAKLDNFGTLAAWEEGVSFRMDFTPVDLPT